jgi:hypothetical protein
MQERLSGQGESSFCGEQAEGSESVEKEWKATNQQKVSGREK